MLLCIAQSPSRGPSGVRHAVSGVTLGYLAHAILAALGLAALPAAAPALFETVRRIGIAYPAYVAWRSSSGADGPRNARACGFTRRR